MIMYTMMTMILQDWLNANFKKTERRELVIIKSENVLTPTSLQKVSSFQNAQIKAKYVFEESSHDEGVVAASKKYLNQLNSQMMELHNALLDIEVDGKR